MKLFVFTVLTILISGCQSVRNFSGRGNPFFDNVTLFDKKYYYTKGFLMKFYDLTDNNLNYFLINGYKKIGFTTLSGKYIGLDRAKEAGNTLGAHIVLYRHDKIGTEYGTKVVGIQGPDKTYNINSKTNGRFGLYSYGSTSVIGNRGFAFGNYDSRTNGTYNSTTTTTVTQPGEFSYFVVPYSEELYLQKAVFLVKTRKK